jgi:hypothetical protein
VAFGGPQSESARSIYPAVVLCAIVLAVVLGSLGFGTTSTTDAARHAFESTVMGSDLVTVGDSRHSDDDCGHDHKSAECSPCSSCSAGLTSITGPTPDVMIVLRASALESHYDDVVPEGIRRPPRPS